MQQTQCPTSSDSILGKDGHCSNRFLKIVQKFLVQVCHQGWVIDGSPLQEFSQWTHVGVGEQLRAVEMNGGSMVYVWQTSGVVNEGCTTV